MRQSTGAGAPDRRSQLFHGPADPDPTYSVRTSQVPSTWSGRRPGGRGDRLHDHQPEVPQPANLSLITQQVAVVGALAVGQTLIILTAGIDLSVGAVMVLSSF